MRPSKEASEVSDSAIAVVGMAGRFPGAGDVDALWEEHGDVMAAALARHDEIARSVFDARPGVTMDDDVTTPFTMSYDYEPEGGPLALIYGPILDRLLSKGFNAFIDDLGPAAQARSAV